jgi:hypothetical protein
MKSVGPILTNRWLFLKNIFSNPCLLSLSLQTQHVEWKLPDANFHPTQPRSFMKQSQKRAVDLVPLWGTLGLILVALYFILSNFTAPSGRERLSSSAYALFYKLYPKLGYRFKTQYFKPQYRLNLPQPRQDLLICFDYDGDARKWRTIRRQWVDRGGVLFIAGLNTKKDPFSSRRLKWGSIQLARVVKGEHAASGLGGVRLNLEGKFLKYFTGRSGKVGEKIILAADRGPLVYQMTSGAGTVLVLADSGLLKNNCLRGDDVAIFVNELLKPYFKHRIYLIDTNVAPGRRATPILVFLFQNQLRYFSWQLLWIGFLFLVFQGKRFGEPQLVAPYARRTLSEHFKAVGNWYQKTQALAIVEGINCDYFQYMVQKLTGLSLKLPLREGSLAKIGAYLTTVDADLSADQVTMALSKETSLTFSRLQKKAQLQERIIKMLRKTGTKE